MKKLFLLMLATMVLSSCNIEDDGPNTNYRLAEVTDADLPEEFEMGKTYEIEVTYRLPDACHLAAGLEARRGDQTGEGRRKIFVAGVASYDANVTECDQDADEEDLLKKEKFSIRIDEQDPYTFLLWTSYNANMESQYDTIAVPVVAPATNPGS